MEKFQFHSTDQSAPGLNITDIAVKLGQITGECLR